MWMVSPPADWFGKESDRLAFTPTFAKSTAPLLMMNPIIAWSAMSVASAAMMMAAGQAMAEAMAGKMMPRRAKKPAAKPKAGTAPKSVSDEALVRPIVSAETTQAATAPVAEPAKPAPAVAKPVEEPAKKAVAKGPSRPAGLEAPRGGTADDLKRISGIGPKLEMVLNDLGVYHFDQIAQWSRPEIEWIDDYLQFKGRVDRDKWIGQAGKLAAE
ncbi:MAG TPA: hypothetical protein VLA28_11600 [Afifellaceae bacterium]|nr:hypothetical protein [Afifellaceae bacterium]